MKISLIGMSGSGKSFWSQRLEAAGFRRFGIDDLIEAYLTEELPSLGLSGIRDVAKWMGQPFDARYPEASARYIALEKTALRDVLAGIQTLPRNENIVVDTTGSVIYAGDALLKDLTGATRMVYLDVPAAQRQRLYEQYLADPKPVIWGDKFSRQPGESDLQALGRSYHELLDHRVKAYENLAHVAMPHHIVRQRDFTAQDFIAALMMRV